MVLVNRVERIELTSESGQVAVILVAGYHRHKMPSGASARLG